MKQPETLITKQDSTQEPALYMAMELGNRQWKLGFTDRRHKIHRVTSAILPRAVAAIWRGDVGSGSTDILGRIGHVSAPPHLVLLA